MTKLAIDTEMIRRLAELLEETGLSEIEVGEGESRIRVARNGIAGTPVPAPPQAAAAVPEPAEPPRDAAAHPGAVTSPMVGTVYIAAEPGAAPFVDVGATVAAGDTVLIIEAMKVMNPIRAPRAGRVAEILVANGDPVEYGDALLIIE
jgi:acetyl-CoA carboxylase biotin carboxyl carrier protein